MKKPIISFLLGSGFSRPDGLRGLAELNERLRAINENEIHIHTSEAAFFLNGQRDLNSWSRWDERLFIKDFLIFYNTEILSAEETFDYEKFYDFYSTYRTNKENKIEIEQFYKRFTESHDLGAYKNRDCLNRIEDFNRTFNQLLASLLFKVDYYEDVSTSNYPPYDSFLGFLHHLVKTCDVKVHSLNHDLLFDWLGRSNLFEHFADGYQLAGSPYYGSLNRSFQVAEGKEIGKSYKVKLETFMDTFDKALCFYKLHGSVSQKRIFTQRQNQPVVRIKTNYWIDGFYVESWSTSEKRYRFEQLFDDVSPDFLSGTTNKIRYYSDDPYYINLFKHFENNFLSSDLLIII